MTDRHTLEAELSRAQESGDFAAQAEALFALAGLASDEGFFDLAQGLYAQAWAAYQRAGDTRGEVNALSELVEAMTREFWDHDDEILIEFDLMHINHLWSMAVDLCRERGDLRGQAEIYFNKGYAAQSREEEWDGLQRALSLYETLGDLEMQARVLMGMQWGASRQSLEPEPFLERALSLYRQVRNQEEEAEVLLELGDRAFDHDHLDKAQSLFETSLTLFILVQSPRAFCAVRRLGALIFKRDGYPTYHAFQMTIARRLLAVEVEDDTNPISFWTDFVRIARKAQDFEAACYAYQQAMLYAVGFDRDDFCADLLWPWGHIEYHHLNRRTIGFARCQAAIAMMSRSSDLERYQSKFDAMVSQMAAYRRKNRSL